LPIASSSPVQLACQTATTTTTTTRPTRHPTGSIFASWKNLALGRISPSNRRTASLSFQTLNSSFKLGQPKLVGELEFSQKELPKGPFLLLFPSCQSISASRANNKYTSASIQQNCDCFHKELACFLHQNRVGLFLPLSLSRGLSKWPFERKSI